MSTTITGIVSKDVVVPASALPEGTRVEIRLITGEVQMQIRCFISTLISTRMIRLSRSSCESWLVGVGKISNKRCERTARNAPIPLRHRPPDPLSAHASTIHTGTSLTSIPERIIHVR